MTAPDLIHTSRLILKRPIEEFAQAIFDNYATDPEVTKYMTWAPHAEVNQTIEFLNSLSRSWDAETEFAWSIFRKADNQLIGMITLRVDSFTAEAGYVLAKSSWGKGYMTEALVAVRELAFSMPAIERFQILCDVDNPASARVMEKAGFEKEGILRKYIRHPNISDVPRDCLCYSFVR